MVTENSLGPFLAAGWANALRDHDSDSKEHKGKEIERMARKYEMKIVRRKWKETAAWVG